MTWINTGPASHVSKNDKGQVSIIRADARTGMFIHIGLTAREEEALRQVLSEDA